MSTDSDADAPSDDTDEVRATDFMGGTNSEKNSSSDAEEEKVNESQTRFFPVKDEMSEQIGEYLVEYHEEQLEAVYGDGPSVVDVDYDELSEFDSQLSECLRTNLSYFKTCLQDCLNNGFTDLGHDGSDVSNKHVPIRISGNEELSWRLGESPAEKVGDLVTVQATVMGRSFKTIVAECVAFRCQRCGTVSYVPTKDDWTIKVPVECHGCEREGPYETEQGNTTFLSYMELELEELPENAVIDGDPESLDAEIVGTELVDDFMASSGSRVEVTGEVMMEPIENSSNQKEIRHYLRIHDVEVLDSDVVVGEMTDEDWDHIERAKELVEDDPDHDLLDVFAHSIHATHRRKMAMRGGVLSLVGAPSSDGNRGFIHTLLIGQPGEGKSEMHQQLRDVAPRSVSAHAGDSTSAGLTSAATQTTIGPNEAWILRPGLLPRGHQGHLFFDELDGMSTSALDSILTPLSEGVVESNKAGKTASFPAETSLIATSNASETTWRDDILPAQQIPFKESLISRFDLIFPFFGDSTEEEDKELAEMILDSHGLEGDASVAYADWMDIPIPEDTVTRYLSHIRGTVEPRIPESSDAHELLVSWFKDMRESATDDVDLTTGPRDLEALVRLSKANARLRMSDSVECEDVRVAFELVNHMYAELGVWKDGAMDKGELVTSTAPSPDSPQEKRRNAIISCVKELNEEDRRTDIEEVYDALEVDMSFEMLHEEWDALTKNGTLAIVGDQVEVLN